MDHAPTAMYSASAEVAIQIAAGVSTSHGIGAACHRFAGDFADDEQHGDRCSGRERDHDRRFPAGAAEAESVETGKQEHHAGRMTAYVDLIALDVRREVRARTSRGRQRTVGTSAR